MTPNNRGGALLAVLWLSAALAAVGFSVSTMVRAETDHVSTNADGLRAWYLATGAVERAIQWMWWGPGPRNPDGTARYWDPTQPRMYMSFPSGDAVVEAIPEMAKLNINFASPDDLSRVVLAVSGDPALTAGIVAAILDWRTPSPGPTAFDQYYFSINPTFRAPHASFQEIEELLSVRGVTPELYYGNYIPDDPSDSASTLHASGGLRDCLSVWGSNGPFDINTASPALMEAMGVPPEGVAAIVARRQTLPFHTMADVASLGFPTPRMGVGGNLIWTLRATARLRRPDGSPSDTLRTAGAVVKLLDTTKYSVPLQVLRWYDDDWSQSALTPFPAAPGTPGVAGP